MKGVLGVALLVATSALASANPLDEARRLSDQGRAAHASGHYDLAISSYQAAYVLAPSPGLLFNLGQAHRLRGDCAAAAIMYRKYLRFYPPQPHRELVQALLAAVDPCPAQVVAGAGRKAAARPAFRHGLAVMIGGGALLGVGGYFALTAASDSDEVARRYAAGAKWRDLEELDAHGRRASTLAVVFAISGGAAVLTGSILLLAGRRDDARSSQPTRFTLAPLPRGGELRFTWHY
jgi:tetratricopeptide (TPR) repeat protein